jgi:hypothetical protein
MESSKLIHQHLETENNALDGLPSISFVVQKLEPLGTEFKTAACPVTGVMTTMEIQRDKERMNEKKYNGTLGPQQVAHYVCWRMSSQKMKPFTMVFMGMPGFFQ